MVAGSFDAIGYFMLGHVFTANMTGNTVLLGLALGQGEGLAALRSIAAVGGFFIGAAVGTLIVLRQDQKQGEWSPAVTRGLGIELGLVGVFTIAVLSMDNTSVTRFVYFLITLAGLSMGIQTAAIKHLNVGGISTTYITGTLASLASGLIFWIKAAGFSNTNSINNSNSGVSKITNKKDNVKFLAAVYVVYIFAAIAVGYIESHWSMFVVLIPISALMFVVLNTLYHQRHHHYH